jgi:hypothetical protein
VKFPGKMNIFIISIGMTSVTALCQVVPLSVTDYTVTSRGIEVVLSNNSDKPVTGFCQRSHSDGQRQIEFLPPHQGILPGATFTETIPLPGMSKEDGDREVATLTITCVVSPDGVHGTVPEDVSSMAQSLAGTSFQAERLSRFLDSIEGSSNDRFRSVLLDSISGILALATTLDDGSRARGDFASGMQNANTIMISRLKQLAMMSADGNNISQLRSELSDIRKEHRKVLEVASAGKRIMR